MGAAYSRRADQAGRACGSCRLASQLSASCAWMQDRKPRPIVELSRTCACGSGRVRLEGRVISMLMCACEDCQKATGTGHSAFALFRGPSVTMTGETRSFTRPSNSGASFTRTFCPGLRHAALRPLEPGARHYGAAGGAVRARGRLVRAQPVDLRAQPPRLGRDRRRPAPLADLSRRGATHESADALAERIRPLLPAGGIVEQKMFGACASCSTATCWSRR